ncbi:hypothetical protein [Methylobrevis albus]|uniref:Uncharacterized protein n=1 Tax=Methylobrevis albus TaxID=2793297 RepID=A0A931N0C7_9HYPH|nr:hypothetical protein [Methylobrevis albus]MBH0239920.1 hypothetical protein [Methylobrevis albus]
MVQIAKFVQKDGQEVYINADMLLYIAPAPGGSALYFSAYRPDGISRVFVQQAPKEVASKLAKLGQPAGKVDGGSPEGVAAKPKPVTPNAAALAQAKGVKKV